jgi:hypothetical protein
MPIAYVVTLFVIECGNDTVHIEDAKEVCMLDILFECVVHVLLFVNEN